MKGICKNKSTEPRLYLFTCDICEQTKKSQLHLGKVNGLGIDPNKENKICSFCYAYRTTYFEQHKDLVLRSIMATLAHTNYWKY